MGIWQWIPVLSSWLKLSNGKSHRRQSRLVICCVGLVIIRFGAPACQDQIAGGPVGVLEWSAKVPHLFLYLPLLPLSSWSSLDWGERFESLYQLVKGEWFICLSFMGIRGAEEDAVKLQLTDKLLQAVLAEARVVCTGQLVLIAGDLDADPAVIPCLAKAISAGRFVDLALAYSLREGIGPAILGCSNAPAASTACRVTDRWFPHHFSLFFSFGIEGGRLRFPAPLFASLCGLHAELTLLISHLLLYLVLFRMPGM